MHSIELLLTDNEAHALAALGAGQKLDAEEMATTIVIAGLIAAGMVTS